MVEPTARFIELSQRFVTGEINAEQFADQAVDFWQREYDRLQADSRENAIIAELCLEADALTNEPPFSTTPEALRESARQALHELMELQKELSKRT
ncbi:MAG: colicin immunity domain-containing protein [Chloroflexota bacterium]